MSYVQVYNNESNVLLEAKKRVSFIFDSFNNIQVSVSGGKDSTVLAHLMLVEAKKRDRKIGIFFLDEEVVYQGTIDQVTYIMEQMYPSYVIPLWLQIEFMLTNAVTQTGTRFIVWETGKHKLWMRPKKSYSIKFPQWAIETQRIRNKNAGLDFYDVFDNFERCYTNTAFVVGLRGLESPNRWRTVSKYPVTIGKKEVFWATDKHHGNNVAMYPLYDWNVNDIWRYIYENKLKYHKIYDYQFKLGMNPMNMRISSLIHEKSFKALCNLPAFEPKTYNKLLKRTKGIALAQETAKNTKLFKVRKLPKNFNSWKKYRDFLLTTHPDQKAKGIFIRRFSKHLDNEYVARQQVRQIILNDYENNLPVKSQEDPRQKWVNYYMENL